MLIIFVSFSSDLEANVPGWYQALTSWLSEEQQKAMQEVATLADQRRAAAQSKKIQQSGGELGTFACIPLSRQC